MFGVRMPAAAALVMGWRAAAKEAAPLAAIRRTLLRRALLQLGRRMLLLPSEFVDVLNYHVSVLFWHKISKETQIFLFEPFGPFIFGFTVFCVEVH
jgi:hypothetical protein